MKESLSVISLGDPRLRRLAHPIKQIDDRLLTLIDALIWTAEKADGVGIAAPQVGIARQLFIIASRPNARYPHAPLMQPTAIINPRIIAHSKEQIADWEGCLSVPNQRGQVNRFRQIEVEYCDRDGNWQQQIFTDFVARIFQHELDHLKGTVFTDRVPDHTTLLTEQEYFAHLNPLST